MNEIEDTFNNQKRNPFEETDQAVENLANYELLSNISQKEILNTQTDAEAGQTSDGFKINLEMRITVLAIEKNQLFNLTLNQLEKQIDANQHQLYLQRDSFNYELESCNFETKTAKIKTQLQAGITLKPDSLILDKDKLIGLSKKGVLKYFESYDQIDKVEIKFKPFWVFQVPRLKNHIQINIQQP
jgi:hypothetical protein